jgi:phage gpG-like protein
MANVSISISPSTAIFASAYGRLAKGFTTFRVPLEQSVRRVMIPSITENFVEGGRPPWEPHSDETIRRRDREGTLGGVPQDILVETGQLFGDAIRLARWDIGRTTAVYSNLPARSAYGRFHQFGASNIPVRPFVEIQAEDADNIARIFDLWSNGIIITNWSRRIRNL